MWGVYEYENSIHIIPCDDEGIIFTSHIGDDFCPCHPECEHIGEDGRYIVNHNQVN